jgi:hypothetical protein
MSVGTFNITSERQLKDIIKKESIFLIGLTSKDCEDCCKHEPIYSTFMETAAKYSPKVPLMRHDVSSSSFIKKYISDIDRLPQLYGVRKGVFYKYHDLMDALKILRFADKLISPVHVMDKVEDVLEFLKPPTGGFQSLKILALVTDIDLLEDYQAALSPISNWFASDFRAVTNKNIISEVRKFHPEINQMNTLILMRVDDTKYLDLEVPQDIRSWILTHANALVEELTPYNFQMYAVSPAPMLIMFVDPKNSYTPSYLEEFRKSARKFEGKVKYVWLNATNPEYIEKKKRLGLSTEILPAVSFNSRNFVNYPMTEGVEISEKQIDNFVQGYIDGKKNNYSGKYEFNGVKLDNCQVVDGDNFEEQVFGEKDSLLIVFSSHLSKESQKAAGVFNRVCKRFNEIGIEGLNVVAFDTALNKIHEKIDSGKIPAVFFKGDAQNLIKFSGQVTALEIMKFVEAKSTHGIKLPELPHLDEQEKEELRNTQKEVESFEPVKEEL